MYSSSLVTDTLPSELFRLLLDGRSVRQYLKWCVVQMTSGEITINNRQCLFITPTKSTQFKMAANNKYRPQSGRLSTVLSLTRLAPSTLTAHSLTTDWQKEVTDWLSEWVSWPEHYTVLRTQRRHTSSRILHIVLTQQVSKFMLLTSRASLLLLIPGCFLCADNTDCILYTDK